MAGTIPRYGATCEQSTFAGGVQFPAGGRQCPFLVVMISRLPAQAPRARAVAPFKTVRLRISSGCSMVNSRVAALSDPDCEACSADQTMTESMMIAYRVTRRDPSPMCATHAGRGSGMRSTSGTVWALSEPLRRMTREKTIKCMRMDTTPRQPRRGFIERPCSAVARSIVVLR